MATDGELSDLIEDFNEGRIQFAFVKVKDPNTTLPKNVLIAWCGGGVPERTKGYFTSHTAAVAKVLHGYHVQITARSDNDLEPESIMRKVADASGSKYSAGSSDNVARSAPPPIKSKPVFTPTSSSAGRIDPIVAARSRRDDNVDEDGWGADAPPVTRTQVEKVESAYRPTKVNMAELTKQKPEPSRFDGGSRQAEASGEDLVKGGYQPVGKVDIAAIRAAAQKKEDDRPTPVKGAYEPVGKVDIAAIRAKAKPAEERQQQPQKQHDEDEAPSEPKPLAERAAAFSQSGGSERITSMPKPKVANKFGGASTFTGTKAPAPGGLGFGGPTAPAAAPVGAASRTFADQGGKTPAQLWAEKKARERGSDFGASAASPDTTPIKSQTSGGEGWKSGYAGKSWSVQAPGYSRDAVEEAGEQHTGGSDGQRAVADQDDDASGDVSALRDRFKDASIIGASSAPPPAPRDDEDEDEDAAPPPVPATSRPSGGFALPGLPSRPPPVEDEPEEEEDVQQRESSPIRVAVPVARSPEPEPEPEPEQPPKRSLPPPVIPPVQNEPEEEEEPAPSTTHPAAVDEHQAQGSGGARAVVLYDYERAEENEIELVEGQYVTDINMVDEDWWMGTNHLGQTGLFPSNYVELAEDDGAAAPAAAPSASEPAARSVPSAPSAPAAATPTATALYDYEAAEDNGTFQAWRFI